MCLCGLLSHTDTVSVHPPPIINVGLSTVHSAKSFASGEKCGAYQSVTGAIASAGLSTCGKMCCWCVLKPRFSRDRAVLCIKKLAQFAWLLQMHTASVFPFEECGPLHQPFAVVSNMQTRRATRYYCGDAGPALQELLPQLIRLHRFLSSMCPYFVLSDTSGICGLGTAMQHPSHNARVGWQPRCCLLWAPSLLSVL